MAIQDQASVMRQLRGPIPAQNRGHRRGIQDEIIQVLCTSHVPILRLNGN